MDYLEELNRFLLETKTKKQKAQNVQPKPVNQLVGAVVIETCPLYMDSSSRHIKNSPFLEEKIEKFLDYKVANKLETFGNNDKPSSVDKPIARAIPGIRKAHLTFDISIWYTISSSNPMIIRLYAVLTHDESGTGQPERIPVQKSVAKNMLRQEFVRKMTVQLPTR